MRLSCLLVATTLAVAAASSASAHTTTTSVWDPNTGRMVEAKHWSLFAPKRPSNFTQRHWLTRKVHQITH